MWSTLAQHSVVKQTNKQKQKRKKKHQMKKVKKTKHMQHVVLVHCQRCVSGGVSTVRHFVYTFDFRVVWQCLRSPHFVSFFRNNKTKFFFLFRQKCRTKATIVWKQTHLYKTNTTKPVLKLQHNKSRTKRLCCNDVERQITQIETNKIDTNFF